MTYNRSSLSKKQALFEFGGITLEAARCYQAFGASSMLAPTLLVGLVLDIEQLTCVSICEYERKLKFLDNLTSMIVRITTAHRVSG